jgi:hypothetical protein
MDVFTAFGLAASAGLNAYLPLLVVSLLAKFTDLIQLSKPWDTLESWWVIGILLVLSTIEFFADKIPAVNHVNDIIQTFVRPVAGAILFAASAKVVTDMSPVFAAVLGILVAGSVHAVKSAAVRPAVTATTGGAGNVPVSVLEDVSSTLFSIIAIVIPALVVAVIIVIAAFVVWWIWRRINKERAFRV